MKEKLKRSEDLHLQCLEEKMKLEFKFADVVDDHEIKMEAMRLDHEIKMNAMRLKLDSLDLHVRWETPRGRYDAVQQQVFPQYETKVYRTRRRRESLLKVLLLSFLNNGAVELVGEGVRCGQRGTCTQHKRYLPQLNNEVVNPTGFADHKGLNVWCGKQCLQ